jgi:hypothetical protein
MAHILLQMAEGLLCLRHRAEKQPLHVAGEAKKSKNSKCNERTFHESIAELFASDDIKRILKYREIYSHMNHASDKGDMCADLLQDIVVKL